ncbi:hypothetical protein GCM10008949_21630 [Deinococcus humi]|nr:hypothetical protein GCM10008949_21630 [Deinococcus humi]
MPSDVDALMDIFTEDMDFGDKEEKEAFALSLRSTFISTDVWLTDPENAYDLNP